MTRDHQRTTIRNIQKIGQRAICGLKVERLEADLGQDLDHQLAYRWIILNNRPFCYWQEPTSFCACLAPESRSIWKHSTRNAHTPSSTDMGKKCRSKPVP